MVPLLTINSFPKKDIVEPISYNESKMHLNSLLLKPNLIESSSNNRLQLLLQCSTDLCIFQLSKLPSLRNRPIIRLQKFQLKRRAPSCSEGCQSREHFMLFRLIGLLNSKVASSEKGIHN